MGLILLEALLALALALLIVWWTMFSGRKRGEIARARPAAPAPTPAAPQAATPAAPAAPAPAGAGKAPAPPRC